MKELSNGQLQDDFLQSLWFQKECHHISRLFYLHPQSSLDKLAIIADKVSEVVGASSTICAATTVPPPIPVIFMQCSANHGLSSPGRSPRAVSPKLLN
ncbi:hypothetical protein TNCV_2849251 [Trichonephila clavipes]|nr:hypothetical protein TNCV_2849251 [Trichonephila clavipes]